MLDPFFLVIDKTSICNIYIRKLVYFISSMILCENSTLRRTSFIIFFFVECVVN